MDEKIILKLKKIKALAEEGIGGEKNAAAAIYKKLLFELDVSPEELNYKMSDVRSYYFKFCNSMEEHLLGQIAYKVIGSGRYYLQNGGKKIRLECTEIEASEIQELFNLYRKKLKEDLEIFFSAFIHRQNIFPDETARLYKAPENISPMDNERANKVLRMMQGIDKVAPPRAAIEQKFFD